MEPSHRYSSATCVLHHVFFPIQRRYRQYISGFEEFLSKDHEESMKSLFLAENESKKTREMTDHRNKLSVEYGRIRLEVYHWEESWRMMKMCQRFLYQISPISWRTEHDWIHRSHSGESITYDHPEDLFGRYRMLGDVASLDALIGDCGKYLSFIFVQNNNSRTCGKIYYYFILF